MMQTILEREKLDLCLSLDFDVKAIICLTSVSPKTGNIILAIINQYCYRHLYLMDTCVLQTHLSYGFVKNFFQELY